MANDRGTTLAATLTRARISWRGYVLPIILLAAWAGLGHTPWADPKLLVPLEQVVLAPFRDKDAANLWAALGASLLRLLAGYAIGVAAGFVLGAAIGLSPLANRMLGASFHAMRQIAVFAWIPLLTAWFGNGDPAKLVFIALTALFPMALNTQRAFAAIPAQWRDVADMLRLSPRRRLTRVMLPAAFPGIATGLELALIAAWLGTVTAEYAMGFGIGIGTFLSAGRDLFRMDIVLLGTLALALIGFLTNHALRLALRRVTASFGDPA
jgi:sulfonate transport system permease protein